MYLGSCVVYTGQYYYGYACVIVYGANPVSVCHCVLNVDITMAMLMSILWC